MRYRRLRIAVSVFFALMAVAFAVLWVRSFRKLDLITRVDSSGIQTTIGSQLGVVYFARFDAVATYRGTGNPYASHGWTFYSREAPSPKSWTLWEHGLHAPNPRLPHWLLAAIAALVSASFYVGWRFSVRTMLIATTLIAVVMGMAARASG